MGKILDSPVKVVPFTTAQESLNQQVLELCKPQDKLSFSVG